MPYYLEKSWERSCKYFPEGMHLPMINDLSRLTPYETFFKQHAKDRIVLDVGAGLGLIGFKALEHGARHVFFVEQNPVTAKNLRALLEHHPKKHQITLIEGDFHTLTPAHFAHTPELLVCELWGPHLWNEGLHATHTQARRLFPKIEMYPAHYSSHFNVVEIPWDETQIWPREQVPGLQLTELYKKEYLGYLLDRSGIRQKNLTEPEKCFSLENDQLVSVYETVMPRDFTDVFFHLRHEIHWMDHVQHYRSTYFYVPKIQAGERIRARLDDLYLPIFDIVKN